MILPTEHKARKEVPIASGVLDYFPDAIEAVAAVSYQGNQQHNPGEPLHWAREKSTDHTDCLIRHFMERGTFDSDGLRHSAKMVWRALAILQLEIESDQKEGVIDTTRYGKTTVKMWDKAFKEAKTKTIKRRPNGRSTKIRNQDR